MSRMNLGEIYYVVAKDFSEAVAVALIEEMKTMSIEVVTVTDADIDTAAVLKGRYNVSYADAFAAMLSINRNAPLVTGDHDFRPLTVREGLQLFWVGA